MLLKKQKKLIKIMIMIMIKIMIKKKIKKNIYPFSSKTVYVCSDDFLKHRK